MLRRQDVMELDVDFCGIAAWFDRGWESWVNFVL